VQVSGRISALLDLGAGFHPDFSGRENILINGIILGMSRSEIRARMQTIIDFSELGDFIDEPVRTYSSGMYMRLAFSVATHVDPDILLIDEILAVGDEHFSRKSRAKMNEFKNSGKTIVLITHDLGTVQAWCDLAAWIDEGRVRSIGSPREVVAQYRQAVELAEALPAPPAPTHSLGDATPTLPQPHASAEAQVLAANGRAQCALQLKRVQLLDELGREAGILEPNDSLDVVVEFETSEDLVDVGFSIRILHSEGLLVYGTSSFLESVSLPNPLPRSGVLRFTIERLGLGSGTYSLDIAAQSRAGIDYDSSKEVCSFSVSSNTQETGIVWLPHRWSLVGRECQASEVQPITGS
jgi:lipopolysaccharide transport system ATP-binding protein